MAPAPASSARVHETPQQMHRGAGALMAAHPGTGVGLANTQAGSPAGPESQHLDDLGQGPEVMQGLEWPEHGAQRARWLSPVSERGPPRVQPGPRTGAGSPSPLPHHPESPAVPVSPAPGPGQWPFPTRHPWLCGHQPDCPARKPPQLDQCQRVSPVPRTLTVAVPELRDWPARVSSHRGLDTCSVFTPEGPGDSALPRKPRQAAGRRERTLRDPHTRHPDTRDHGRLHLDHRSGRSSQSHHRSHHWDTRGQHGGPRYVQTQGEVHSRTEDTSTQVPTGPLHSPHPHTLWPFWVLGPGHRSQRVWAG